MTKKVQFRALAILTCFVVIFYTFSQDASIQADGAKSYLITSNPYTGENASPNCTWYAWQALHDREGIDYQYPHNAYQWATESKNADAFWSEHDDKYVSAQQLNTPYKGDILVIPISNGYPSGHVAFVESDLYPDGTFAVSEQNFGDVSPGINTKPYPYTQTKIYKLSDYPNAVFLHFSSDVTTSPLDDATLVAQSPNQTITPGAHFGISFTWKNTGDTTWLDSAGYTLSCVANCMSAGDAGFGGSSVLPGQDWQFNITLIAPTSSGSYASAWVPEHNKVQFGNATMFVVVTVINACLASNGLSGSGFQANILASNCVTPPPTSGGSQGGTCSMSSPSLTSPANGSTWPQSQYVTLTWSTPCAQSYAELSGGPYGTLNFGGWHAASKIDIGTMWPGTYTWHVKVGDGSGRESGWSGNWSFTIGGSAPVSGSGTCSASDGVTLYGDPNYGGYCYTFGVGEYADLSQYGLDQIASSLHDAGGSYHITLYDQKGLTGTPAYFDSDTAQLMGYWDNRARSMRVERHGPTSCNPGTDGIIAYANSNPDSACLFITGDIPDLSTLNWANAINVLRFAGEYRNTTQLLVYRQANYQDLCGSYWQDQSDIRPCSGHILSVQVRPFTPPTPVPTAPGTVYAGNIAPQASLSPGGAWPAVDGNLDTEWIGGHGASVTLSWSGQPAPVIHRVVVWDRSQSSTDNNQINGLGISFSDGASLSNLDMISGGPRCIDISFAATPVTWIKISPTDSSGNNGFKEIEVWATTGPQNSDNTCVNQVTVTLPPPAPTPTPPPGATPTPTLIPTPTPPPGATPTPTLIPTPTPPPVPTPTPTPIVYSGNVAGQASLSPGGTGAVIDENLSTEWVYGHGASSTITFSWSGPVTIDRIVVWDRSQNNPDNNQINLLGLSFSDGTVVQNIDMVSGGPRCADITFSNRTVTWVQVYPWDSSGTNGYKEIEIWATTGPQSSGLTCSNHRSF